MRSAAAGSAIAVAVLLASCAAPRPYLRNQRELVIPGGKGSIPSVIFDAAWEKRGDRYCVSRSLVTLTTAAGPISLQDANLCASLDPLSIEGDAVVGFPRLGLLDRAGVRMEGGRASLRLVPGRALRTLEIDGQVIRHDPNRYYLFVRYDNTLSLAIGNASLSGDGVSATMVLAPQEGLIYVAGRLSAAFIPGGEVRAAFGFSPQGRLVYRPARPLSDDRGPVDGRVEGHLLFAASVPLLRYPVTVSGELVLDLDADRDGVSVLAGDDGDLRIGMNGGLEIGYAKRGFDFSFKVGDAAILYDDRAGALYFAAGDAGGLFAGTPLAVLFQPTSGGAIDGFFRSIDDFAVRAKLHTRLGGFLLAEAQLVLDPQGVRARGQLQLPANIGKADLQGEIGFDGSFALVGRGDLTLARVRLAAADVLMGRDGVKVAGLLRVPGLGGAQVAGKIEPSGNFALSGTSDFSPAGLRMTQAAVSITPAGALVSGEVRVLATRVAVSGLVSHSGFALTGRTGINLALIKGYCEVTISERGVRAVVHGKACALRRRACIDLAGFDVDTRGRVCLVFPVIGKQCVKVL